MQHADSKFTINGLYKFSQYLGILWLLLSWNMFLEAGEKPSLGYEQVNVAAEANGGEAVCSVRGSSKKSLYPYFAIDGKRDNAWVAPSSKSGVLLEINFIRNYPISQIILYPSAATVSSEYNKDYKLQYYDGSEWKDVVAEHIERAGNGAVLTLSIKPVNTRKIRFLSSKNARHGLWELEAYAKLPGAVRLSNGSLFTEREMSLLPHSLTGRELKLNKGWKVKIGDNPDYAEPGCNDSKWKKVLNSRGLRQGKNGEWVWYRVNFVLPDGWEKKNVLLDAGQMSSFEEIYLNGKKAVTFGDPDTGFIIHGFRGLMHSKYFLHQRLPLPAGILKSGKNVLAIRLRVTGKSLFGSYGGWPSLKEYQPVFGRLALKSDGADAIKTLLTTAAHLNKFSPGEEVIVKPELFSLSGKVYSGNICLDVYNADNQKVLAVKAPAKCTDRKGNVEKLIRFNAPARQGKYRAELKFVSGGKTLWQKKLDFTVCDKLTFSMPVNPAINQYPAKDFTVEVSKKVVGAYGPGRTDFRKKNLFDVMPDLRGGLVCSAYFSEKASPLLCSAQVRSAPLRPVPRPAMINWPDGWEDAWFYGYVIPGERHGKFDVKLIRADWSGRTYAYSYPDGVKMDFSISNVSPALRIKSNTQRLKLFDRIADFGIGLPTHIAYQGRNGIKVVAAETGTEGKDMGANWLLVYFNGAKGWKEFDVPFLIVLEKRPVRIETAGGALRLDFPEAAGTVQIMPLYGVTILPPDKTAKWRKTLPGTVVERCRFWSRVLTAAPAGVVRTAMIDYGKDLVVVRDKFRHLGIKDDWNTTPIKLAFVSPTMTLAQSAGNISMATGSPARDLHYGTLHGPLLATENSDEQRIGISNLLHFVREVRVVEQANTPRAQKIIGELNRAVKIAWQKNPSFLDRKINQQGSFFVSKALLAGNAEPVFTNTLRILPLLDQPLRDEIAKGIQREIKKYLFYNDKPEKAWKKKVLHKDIPQLFRVSNPQTGLTMSFTPHYNCGTDAACWESLRIYVAWRYAWFFNDYSFIKQHYQTIKEIYNTARNTHDWQISATWDAFAGVRVGNGLQETGTIHGGAVAMARLAKKIGDKTTFAWASYHAVVQIIGMQAQLAASGFRRAYRPWSSGHSNAARYEDQEILLPRYYAEQNAYAGFCYSTIGSKFNVIGASRSYCMTQVPENMRPYELWTDCGNDFFNNPHTYEFLHASPIYWTNFDAVFYLTKNIPLPWDDFMKMRLAYAKAARNWDSLADFCGILDYLGKVKYEKLW